MIVMASIVIVRGYRCQENAIHHAKQSQTLSIPVISPGIDQS